MSEIEYEKLYVFVNKEEICTLLMPQNEEDDFKDYYLNNLNDHLSGETLFNISDVPYQEQYKHNNYTPKKVLKDNVFKYELHINEEELCRLDNMPQTLCYKDKKERILAKQKLEEEFKEAVKEEFKEEIKEEENIKQNKFIAKILVDGIKDYKFLEQESNKKRLDKVIQDYCDKIKI